MLESYIKSWQETRQSIASHSGNVVVIDIWSTSCLPCIAAFPEFLELQQTFPERVVCISLNVDYQGLSNKPPETYRDRVLDRLTKLEATTVDHILSSDSDESIYRQLELTSIPITLVFDRSGKLHSKFDSGQFTYREHVIPLIEELLDGA